MNCVKKTLAGLNYGQVDYNNSNIIGLHQRGFVMDFDHYNAFYGFESLDENSFIPDTGRNLHDDAFSSDSPYNSIAGSVESCDYDYPNITGRVCGLSTEVDADGEFLLILHLENSTGRSQHYLTLTPENLQVLRSEIDDCLSVLSSINKLGEAADEALIDFDDHWVTAPDNSI
jgi:hypothetical protein